MESDVKNDAGVRDWKSRWKVKKELPGGGQGYTFLVEPRQGSQGEQYVLKQLKDQNSPERRKRLYLEAQHLRIISHPHIARLIESNDRFYGDLETNLYIVTEYIIGRQLDDFVGSGRIEVGAAVQIVLALLDAVSECHRLKILHRDIKPSNIIVRSSDNKPVLIDFGLSFNEIAAFAPDTETGQHLGNRFIYLPEMTGSQEDKRNTTSDLTQLVGILFYLITGSLPRALIDHKGDPPHRRGPEREIIAGLGRNTSDCLIRIFDIGFSPEIQRRWVSSDRLHKILLPLSDPINYEQQTVLSFEDRMSSIRLSVENNRSYITKKRYEDICSKIHGAIIDRVVIANKKLEGLVLASLQTSTKLMNGERHYDVVFSLLEFNSNVSEATVIKVKALDVGVQLLVAHRSNKPGAIFGSRNEPPALPQEEQIVEVSYADSNPSGLIQAALEDLFEKRIKELSSKI